MRVAALLTAAPLAAHAVCLNPLGCAASTYDECVQEASTRPTELGVRLAAKQCYETFVKPMEERQKRDAAREADEFAKRWALSIATHTTAEALTRAIGKAAEVSGPEACEPFPGSSTKPTFKCYTYRYEDPHGRVCAMQAFGTIATRVCRFQFQALEDAKRTVWVAWPDPL